MSKKPQPAPEPRQTAAVLFGAVMDAIEGDMAWHRAVLGELAVLVAAEDAKIVAWQIKQKRNSLRGP